MSLYGKVLCLILFILLFIACTETTNNGEATLTAPEEAALIMFYTDD